MEFSLKEFIIILFSNGILSSIFTIFLFILYDDIIEYTEYKEKNKDNKKHRFVFYNK